MKRLKKVYTAGCFDLFHPGHMHLIEEAQKYGDSLTVAIVSDRAMREYKDDGRPVVAEGERMAVVEKIPGVDETFLCDEDPHDIALLEKIHPDVIVMGKEHDTGDQAIKVKNLQVHFPDMEIILLEKMNPEEYSTTAIIEKQ